MRSVGGSREHASARSANSALPARDLIRDLVRAEPALDGPRNGRGDGAEQRTETEPDRRHVDLVLAALGRALALSVRTGTYCSYRPVDELLVEWQL